MSTNINYFKDQYQLPEKCCLQIKECESQGISGVILYADPADTEHHHLSVCDLTAPYATVNDGGAGDPVTPGFPAYGTLQVKTNFVEVSF